METETKYAEWKSWIPIYSPIWMGYRMGVSEDRITDFTKWEFFNGAWHGWYGGIFILLATALVVEVLKK